MATVASTVSPFELDAIELVGPLPYGAAVTPYETPPPYRASAPIANRFPTPASAVGFLVDPLLELGIPIAIDGLEGPYVVGGALAPSGDYLEPNLGQIWPR